VPTSVTSTAGTSFHLFQLPDLSAPEPEDSITFTTIDNELSEGHRSSALLGSNTGVRSWKLNFPTTSAYVSTSAFGATLYTPTTTGVSGVSCTREQYLRTLFHINKTTGVPFVYQWPQVTGQYYLVDFAENDISFSKRKGVNIYSTGVTLKQRRINGETVFDTSLMSSLTRYNWNWFSENGHFTNWSSDHGALTLDKVGDVVLGGNAQNGHNTVRFNGSASTGYVTNTTSDWSLPMSEIFIVMQMREATFSNAAGVLTGTTGVPVLVGTSAGTKFQNQSITGLEYYLNGTSYAVSDQQAPMNTWGIVQLRFTSTGISPSVLVQFGRDQTSAGTYAKMDVGEIISSSDLIPVHDGQELIQHLKVKWGVTD